MYSIHQGVWLTVVVYVGQCVGQGYFLVNILDLGVHRWWETMDWNLAGYSVEKQGLLKDHTTVFACLNSFSMYITPYHFPDHCLCLLILQYENFLSSKLVKSKRSLAEIISLSADRNESGAILIIDLSCLKQKCQKIMSSRFFCFSFLVNWIDLRFWQVVRQTKKFEDDTMYSDTIGQIEKLNRQLYWQLFWLENLNIKGF